MQKPPVPSTDIADRVQLFNESFAAAWHQLTKNPGAINADTARWLAAFIRSKITVGEIAAEVITAEAVKEYARRLLAK